VPLAVFIQHRVLGQHPVAGEGLSQGASG
jgi:hypothetical protein